MDRTLVVAAVAVGVLAAIVLARVLLARRQRLPYRRTEHLLTAAERSFSGVLRQVVEDTYHIAWKVRMADLIYVPPGTKDRQRHMNRILAKHLDFVLCDPETSAPLLAIELDDSSHLGLDRRKRDAFVNSALSAAGLPLLRVTVRRSYAGRELAASIRRQMGSRNS